MSDTDTNFEVTNGTVQPVVADTYELVVDDDRRVQMKPAKK